jgi:sugar O-acyltransferase (sialic acid O-acetyltransferase NeuD family)
MKKTVILGARADGHAKVVLEILQAQGEAQVVGFIDDDAAKRGSLIRDIPVLGSMDDLPDLILTMGITHAIAAIGHNAGRRALAEQAERLGLELLNAIHPTVHLDSDVVLGKGNCLCQGVIVVTGTVIGNCVNVHTGTTIDHDNVIEDGANLGPGVHLAGRVRIGKDAFVGTGAVVIPDGLVGAQALVAAGAVVIRPVPIGARVAGVPARPMR